MKEIRSWQNYERSRKDNEGYLSLEEESFLFFVRSKSLKDKDRSTEELVKWNLSLLHSIAVKYKWSNLGYEDLVSFGMIGILGAIERFDRSKGVRFGTFASHYILGHIRKGVEAENNLIKRPAYITSIGFRLRDVNDGSEVTKDHLDLFSTGRYTLNNLKNAVSARNYKMVDLDSLLDFSYEDESFLNDVAILDLIKPLTSKQKLCFLMRFGYDGFSSHTFKEIDFFTGWDSEQVIVGAFHKIRRYTKESDWYDLLR